MVSIKQAIANYTNLVMPGAILITPMLPAIFRLTVHI